MAAGIELNPIANFDIHGDRLSQSWERWHRSFELYSTGKGITDAKQKRALLLHSAGLDVQDIFFTLNEEEGDDDYLKCVNTLKKYFSSKVNFSVERYNFRSIRQLETETIDQYVTRLKQQVVLCDFNDPDSQIRDQIIEKCKSHKLRTRLLEQGPGLTLDTKNMESLLSQLREASKEQYSVIKQYRSENLELRKQMDKADKKPKNDTTVANSSVNTDTRKKLSHAESELTNARETINDLKHQNEKLKSKLSENEDKLRNTTEASSSVNTDTRKKLSHVESELTNARETINDLKHQNENLKTKLSENENKLKNANQTIDTLQNENQKMKRDLNFKNIKLEEVEKNFDLNKTKIEHLDSQWQEQIRENQRLMERLTSLSQENDQHKDCLHRLQKEKDECIARKHNTVHVQMYAAVNKELCNKMMDELEGMLSLQFELCNSNIQVAKHSQPPPQSEVPLIVVCINASRLGTDVNQALQNISRSQTVAVVVLHHKEIHALPRQPSDKLLIGSDYKHIGAIVDIAYLTSKGIYACDMNNKSLDRLVDFIRSNSR